MLLVLGKYIQQGQPAALVLGKLNLAVSGPHRTERSCVIRTMVSDRGSGAIPPAVGDGSVAWGPVLRVGLAGPGGRLTRAAPDAADVAAIESPGANDGNG